MINGAKIATISLPLKWPPVGWLTYAQVLVQLSRESEVGKALYCR